MHMVHDQEQGEIHQQGPERAEGDQLQVTGQLVFWFSFAGALTERAWLLL